RVAVVQIARRVLLRFAPSAAVILNPSARAQRPRVVAQLRHARVVVIGLIEPAETAQRVRAAEVSEKAGGDPPRKSDGLAVGVERLGILAERLAAVRALVERVEELWLQRERAIEIGERC